MKVASAPKMIKKQTVYGLCAPIADQGHTSQSFNVFLHQKEVSPKNFTYKQSEKIQSFI